MEWIILQYPYLSAVLILAVLMNCFDRFKKRSKGVLTLVSALIFVVAAAFLCVLGAGYHELIVLMLVFLLFNFDIIKEWEGKE